MLSLITAGRLTHHGVLAFKGVELGGLVGAAGDEAGNYDSVVNIEAFGRGKRLVTGIHIAGLFTGCGNQFKVLVDEGSGFFGLGILVDAILLPVASEPDIGDTPEKDERPAASADDEPVTLTDPLPSEKHDLREGDASPQTR